MIPELRRKLTSEGVIGVAITLGLHFMLVEPQHTKLVELQKRAGEIAAAIPSKAAEIGALPRAMAVTAECQTEAALISERGRLARSESVMFTHLMQLAADHKIHIDRVDPRPPIMPIAPPAPGAADSALSPGVARPAAGAPDSGAMVAPPRQGDAGIGYSISLTGDYSNLCSFLTALQSEVGYTLVRSIRVQTGAGGVAGTSETGVAATIETAHFAVDPSPIVIPAPPSGAPGSYAGAPTQ